jgi:hypothetical protein
MLGKPSRRTRRHLESNGLRATAAVVEIGDSGPTFTDGTGPSATKELLLSATLRVQPQEGPAFEKQGRFRFPKFHPPKPGDSVEVIYDPDDHDKLMLYNEPLTTADVGASLAGTGLSSGRDVSRADQAAAMKEAEKWLQAYGQSGAGLGAGGDRVADEALAKLERLQALKDQGALSDEEFEREKAKLVGEG